MSGDCVPSMSVDCMPSMSGDCIPSMSGDYIPLMSGDCMPCYSSSGIGAAPNGDKGEQAPTKVDRAIVQSV